MVSQDFFEKRDGLSAYPLWLACIVVTIDHGFCEKDFELRVFGILRKSFTPEDSGCRFRLLAAAKSMRLRSSFDCAPVASMMSCSFLLARDFRATA